MKPDHRKDGTFRRGHKAASKGEPRRMWSGRLPERTHNKLRSLVASGAHDSQADAIAAAMASAGQPDDMTTYDK